MPTPTSFQALAAEIERALRTDLDPPGSAAYLASSIDEIMRAEARAGELRLAYLRLAMVAPYIAVAGWAGMRQNAAGSLPDILVPALVSVVWLVASVTLVLALRRGWYRRWVSHAGPLVDAGMILAIAAAAFEPADSTNAFPAEVLGYVIALCGYLSVSGALRLSRSAARTGTGLAVGVFVVAAMIARTAPVPAAAIALTLLATGLFATSVTALLRRVVMDEVARDTLSRMVREAEVTIEAREQVLKIVSHDLRNPLHTISMSVSLLLDLPAAQDQLPDHLHRIKRAGQRMNRLIEDLLDVAKLESGRLGIDAKPIEVAPLMREAQEMLAPLAADKGVDLEVKVTDQLPTITCDGGRVLQVLSNLVGNSVKFTPKGGRIVIRADPAPGGARFSVTDTGPGIPQEQLAKIFGRFWQADPTDRRGIGLGLAIAKGIVEAHGGRLQVDSPPGEGATFHFKLDTVLSPTASGDRERRRSGTSS